MTVMTSNFENLFTFIFPDKSQCASLLIKLLLVLESEKLIPLFEVNHYEETSIKAFVTNRQKQHLSVDKIINTSVHSSRLPLFFGSNFQVTLAHKISKKLFEKNTFNTFLIFTYEGLLLEYPDSHKLLTSKYQSYLIEWDYWDNIFLTFDKDEPKCTLLFNKNQGDYLAINITSELHNEVEIIEQQLPLIFAYFVMKQFWQYVENYRHQSFLSFNPNDFIYFDQIKLSTLINNVLNNINITPSDLDTLVRKINLCN